jgi:Transposase DDE domain group 1
LQVTRARRNPTLQVVADDTAATSRAGTALLLTLADRLGLTGGLSRAMAPTRERRSPHDPGGVLRDLAVMLADGGDCLHDLGAIRDQVDLFGRVASDATAWRVIDAIDQGRLQAIRAARARARERAWAAGARPGEVVLDIDATLVQAHSDKEGAAPTYKRGYGFHPMLCYLDASGEALAGTLRPGNAGANTARDHIAVLLDALDQLPAAVREDEETPILVRTDAAGATHEFLEAVVAMGCAFSVGYELSESVRQAILALPESAWRRAVRQDGEEREGAWVAELDGVSLTGWPEGARLVCRRERPHPGAQFSFTDQDGHRFQVILTNQPGDAVALEARHRARARVEDAIRAAKDTGLQNLPFREFAPNAVWLELVLVAQDLIAWGQRLLLGGELARCEPKRLRYRLLHVAARITRSGRRLRLHLPAHWPWAGALVAAFRRLRGLPAPAG